MTIVVLPAVPIVGFLSGIAVLLVEIVTMVRTAKKISSAKATNLS